jgi:glycosyltransferase involved in cell wall biosynthesis
MITILLPLYNGLKFLLTSVNSVRNQTFINWNLYIGVNGYSENSDVYKSAKKYEELDKRIKVFDFFWIKGKSATLNEMVKLSKNDWIALIDVDDIWTSSKLEKQIEYLSNYDVIGSKCSYFGDKCIIPEIPTGDITHFNFYSVNPVINSSVIIKKELCNWDIDCFIEDYKLWLRLWKEGKKFYNVNQVLVFHRIHSESAFNAKGNDKHRSELVQKMKTEN